MRRIFLIAAALAPAPALAAETITYSYDARGRLVQVARSGSVNSGVVTTYAFDRADNRTTRQVSGAPAANRIVAVPLNGFTVIPLIDN
jgi:hypothetical protein